MRVKNAKASLSLLYLEIKVLIWIIEYTRIFTLFTCNICDGLFTVSENGISIRRMIGFQKLFRKYQNFKRNFQPFKDYSHILDAKFKSG